MKGTASYTSQCGGSPSSKVSLLCCVGRTCRPHCNLEPVRRSPECLEWLLWCSMHRKRINMCKTMVPIYQEGTMTSRSLHKLHKRNMGEELTG